jgi:cytohesin
MAVDVMHLSAIPTSSSPRRSPAHISFSSSPSHKASPSRQQQQLQKDLKRSSLEVPCSNSPSRSSAGGDSLSSSELSWTGLPEDQQAAERIQQCRKQLEEEIDDMVAELTRIGEEMNCTSECLQILRDSDETPQKKDLRRARKIFKNKPKDAIKFLLEKELLNDTPEDVALYLFCNGMDKTALGDYLGEGKEFNIKVLQEFVRLHKFHGMDLVRALRVFLWSFQLPGEAQKIDRMMESFASQFCECNPGTFSTTDACYILSFAIIMLNTSLHNPNVKNKPSLEQFISMNRDIDDGKELPRDMLTVYYDAIKSEPFQYHQGADEMTEMFFNPDHKGWLVKEGGKHKTWKKRWFILTENCLYYFKSPNDKEPRGIIPLENLEVRNVPIEKRSFCFEICLNEKLRTGTLIKACKTKGADHKVVEGRHLNYRMQVRTHTSAPLIQFSSPPLSVPAGEL